MTDTESTREENLSSVTSNKNLSFDSETSTRFDKTSAVLNGRMHNFSAEYELGFRNRNEGKPSSSNPYSTKLARERWQRGWNARNKYTDAGYKWVEPVTDSKAVVWVIAVLIFGGALVAGLVQGSN
ncbi:MAG: hypothetical protein WAS26_01450 [Paracoccaceae bacterium]